MSRDFRHSEKITWLLLPEFLIFKIKGSCHKIFECSDEFLGSCCLLPPVGSLRHFQALAGPDLVHVQVGMLGTRTPVVILSVL